jgi:hypothetical protein
MKIRKNAGLAGVANATAKRAERLYIEWGRFSDLYSAAMYDCDKDGMREFKMRVEAAHTAWRDMFEVALHLYRLAGLDLTPHLAEWRQ